MKIMPGPPRRRPGNRQCTLAIIALTLMLMALPSPARALGAEDVSFYGRLDDGRIARLRFLGDPEPWSQDSFLYGSRGIRSLSFCWTPSKDETRTSLRCSERRGGAVGVTYTPLQSGQAPPKHADRTPVAALYRSIARRMRLGDGQRRGDATLLAAYACSTGCTAAVPRYLFEVGVYD